jgi:predicted Fe-Mo cluster-binding NifX family protein
MESTKTVAIACESAAGLDGDVCGHFGGSPFFVVAEIAGGAIVSSKCLASPGHGQGCSMPGFVHSLGATAVIVGGIGGGAVNGLGRCGITVIAGASGNAGEALRAFAAGTLVPGKPGCQGHGGHGGHGDHGCSHHN